jgi:hypothetical protein
MPALRPVAKGAGSAEGLKEIGYFLLFCCYLATGAAP